MEEFGASKRATDYCEWQGQYGCEMLFWSDMVKTTEHRHMDPTRRTNTHILEITQTRDGKDLSRTDPGESGHAQYGDALSHAPDEPISKAASMLKKSQKVKGGQPIPVQSGPLDKMDEGSSRTETARSEHARYGAPASHASHRPGSMAGNLEAMHSAGLCIRPSLKFKRASQHSRIATAFSGTWHSERNLKYASLSSQTAKHEKEEVTGCRR